MKNTNYEYSIVQIALDNFPDNGLAIVPAHYLMYINEKMFVKYLCPPFSEDDRELIKGMVQMKGASPLEDWPLIECSALYYCCEYSSLNLSLYLSISMKC